MIFYLSSRGAPKSTTALLYHIFLNLSNYAPRVKCVKTILSLCQHHTPPTHVTCIIWPSSQYHASWLTSCDAFHTAWLTARDLPNAAHAACPPSRTTAWLASCDPHHLRNLHHMTCITIVTTPTWSKSRRCPRSQKWRLLGNYTEVNYACCVTHIIGL